MCLSAAQVREPVSFVGATSAVFVQHAKSLSSCLCSGLLLSVVAYRVVVINREVAGDSIEVPPWQQQR